MPRIAMLPPRRCSQIRFPVLPSIAWMMPLVLFRIDRAVVGERRRLVGAAFVHRPDPRELEVLRVVPRDLRQRAEVRRVVIAPQHEPVARRRIPQHLVGDAREVPDLARHGETYRRGGCCAASTGGGASPRPPASPRRRPRPDVRRLPPLRRRRLRRRASATDRHVGRHGEHLSARACGRWPAGCRRRCRGTPPRGADPLDRAASTTCIVLSRSRVDRVLQPPMNAGPESAGTPRRSGPWQPAQFVS